MLPVYAGLREGTAWAAAWDRRWPQGPGGRGPQVTPINNIG